MLLPTRHHLTMLLPRLPAQVAFGVALMVLYQYHTTDGSFVGFDLALFTLYNRCARLYLRQSMNGSRDSKANGQRKGKWMKARIG